MVIEHTRFTGIFNRADTPNGVQGVLHHDRFSLLRHLLVGRIEGDEVNVRLDQLTQERVNGGNRSLIQSREEHLHVPFISQTRVKHAVRVVLCRWKRPRKR